MSKQGDSIRVLHIASGDLWAGAEVQLFTLVKALHALAGITPVVVLLNHGRLEQELCHHGIKVSVIDETKLNGIKILRQLITVLRTTKPDVIHTHRRKENILGSMAAAVSGKIPSIRTVHGAPEHIPSWRQPLTKLIDRLDWFCGYYLQQKIIAVSEDMAEFLKKDFPNEKIRVIENGVDLEAIRSHTLEKCVKTNGDVFKVGIAGRLVPVKRVDLFIKTARYMLEHYPEFKIKFHIFGDGPLYNQLTQLSLTLNTESVIFFKGHCNNMPEELQQLDALLMTSEHEGLPMILLEAMTLRTPIIAHAVGGIPALLDYGSCGILIDDDETQSYASKIISLAQNKDKAISMVTNAEKKVASLYSSERNAQRYCNEYH